MEKQYKIGIYCGHGKSSDGTWDPGCTYKTSGKTYTEAELMLEITESFVKHARECGIVVYTDVTGGNMKNMNKCIEIANKYNLDYYISVHCDYSEAPTGTYPYYCKGSTKGKKLATELANSVKKEMGLKIRKIASSTDLGEVTNTNMPACIFETGSIKADLKILRDKPEEYGIALAKGLCNFLGITYKGGAQNKAFTIIPKMDLKIRKEASLDSDVVNGQVCKKGTKYTIVETANDDTRGKLKSGVGWITITDKYVKKV